MITKLVRIDNLFYADSEINEEIGRLENQGYKILDVKYIDKYNPGCGLLYHFLIMYE